MTEGRAARVVAGRTSVLPATAALVLADATPEQAGELRECLADLIGAVEAVCEGRDPAVVRQALPARARRPGLLAALRRAVLDRALAAAGPGEDAAEALSVLRAIEELERPAAPAAAEGSATLSALMAEPDAYRLLVEVAHDLRSPLGSILFLSEALRGGFSGEVNELQRTQLGLMYSAALGLQSMVSDVVDLASTGGPRHDPPTAVSIRAVFGRIHELVQPVAEQKGLELRFQTPERDRYVGHSFLLGRVLLNLVTNALKFTERGHVQVEARALDHSRVQFRVQDTGRGLNEHADTTLFEPFKKSGDARGYFFSGSGLGLTIARRMLRMMDADLQFASTPGQGTVFYFELHMPRDRAR